MAGPTTSNTEEENRPMRIYGLTGGIATGKSEAAKRFVELGIPVIDADKAGHEAIEPGGAAAEAVLQTFGEGILTDRRIDRAKLGALVFSDEQARQRLNAIVHPIIKRKVAARCRALADQGYDVAIVDAALLAEGRKREACLSGLILITSSHDTRLLRLVEFRGLSADEAQWRIHAQAPPEEKVALADWVIKNDGTIDELCAQVNAVAKELKRHEG